MLLDQRIQLTVFQHLPEAAHREAEDCHRGAKIERLLKCTRGAHFVIAQANPKAAAFPIASPPAAGIASAIAACLSPVLLGICVGISHGPRPAVRRKCDASQGGEWSVDAPP